MTSPDETLAKVEAAFAGVSRPTNSELLHESCADDMDLEILYDIESWTDMTDSEVIGAYSALSFLSPAGFRYFFPAYMRFALLNPESPEAVIDSAVWALFPSLYRDSKLEEFAISKYALLDDAQRDAIVAFLEAMDSLGHPDAAGALEYWRSED